jgi:hypothetical protein
VQSRAKFTLSKWQNFPWKTGLFWRDMEAGLRGALIMPVKVAEDWRVGKRLGDIGKSDPRLRGNNAKRKK